MSIPVPLIAPYVKEWVGDDESRVSTLSVKATVDEALIWRVLSGTAKAVGFNIADRLLCATGCVTAWHTGRLGEVYWKHPLPGKIDKGGKPKTLPVCARVGCSNTPPPSKPRGGRRIYCSRPCLMSAARDRRRERQTGNPVRTKKNRRYDKCPRGHDRSPENVSFDKRGKIGCRECHRNDMRALYQDPEYRARKVEASRAYRARKKAGK
mgnify:CR=1 FL=1